MRLSSGNTSSWRSSRSGLLTIVSAFALAFVFSLSANAQAITEGFDNITTLPTSGWFLQNNSVPVGSTGWFQGNSATFTSQAGAATAYIGANFNNTTGTNTISNWLLAPNRTMNNGDVYTFYTRTTTANPFPDRLQVRLSTNGASTNVGSGPTGIGDFTTLLLDINPSYATGGVYPEVWTQFTITISGLSGPTSGRLGFRYFVENGGPTGANSNYIGIDTFTYTPAPAAPIKSPVDFNGDGKTDWSVVRNTGGGAGGQITWFNCTNGVAEPGCFSATPFGIATDFFTPSDFDGDGKTDITVWRGSTSPGVSGFYILQSSNNTVRYDSFGQSGDDPTVVGDYTGDGKADPAVYRAGASAGQQSYFYYRASSGPFSGQIVFEPWGQNGDFVAPGDYDGDGKYDFVIQRNAGGGQAIFWQRINGTNAVSNFIFGTPTDVVVPGDYDGDGKTDICVIRGISGSIWWFLRASTAPNSVTYLGPFGLSATDFATQGDYNGDGKTDIAVWRSNADATQNFFHVLTTGSGAYSRFEWGAQGDYPVANYNSH
ncbi:MAG: VCBS repeat-containing protein [Acidobacteria bacterium]|nr:VCBS repeat-containing protein [Acidobacteriota bacterium]MCW5949168.1 VCBS repeat-containing protein [Pyrinomonadaceae bacterium]